VKPGLRQGIGRRTTRQASTQHEDGSGHLRSLTSPALGVRV
jgi:hypothetical protein